MINGIGEILVYSLHVATDIDRYVFRDKLPVLPYQDFQGVITGGDPEDEPEDDTEDNTDTRDADKSLPDKEVIIDLLQKYYQDEPYDRAGLRLQLGILDGYGPDVATDIIYEWKSADKQHHDLKTYSDRVKSWTGRNTKNPITFGSVRYLINRKAKEAGHKLPFSKYQIIGLPNADTLQKYLDLEAIQIAYEVNQTCYFYKGKGEKYLWLWKRLEDMKIREWIAHIQECVGRPTKTGVTPCIYSRDALENALALVVKRAGMDTFNSFTAWLTGIEAGYGSPGYENVLVDFLGAENTPMTRWASRFLFYSIIERQFDPGCSLDYTVVLYGPEGAGKSKFLKNLLPEAERDCFGWFNDSVKLSMAGKEIVDSVSGCVLVEFAEMAGVNKTENNHIKQFLTSTQDQPRLSYDRRKTVLKRSWITVGTTNDEDCLPADDHNRRFIVIYCPGIGDVPWMIDRLQDMLHLFWDDAYTDYKRSGFSVILPPNLSQVQKQMNVQHRHTNVSLEEQIDSGIATLHDKTQFRLADMNNNIISDPRNSRQVSTILKRRGYKKATYQENKKTVRGWTFTL